MKKKEITKLIVSLYKLLKDYKIDTTIIYKVKVDVKDDLCRITVVIDDNVYKNMEFLGEGAIIVILKKLSKKLPDNINSKKVEWLFVPKEIEKVSMVKTAQYDEFDTGLLNSALDRLSNVVLNSGLPEVLMAYGVAKYIANKIDEEENKKVEQMKSYQDKYYSEVW